MNVNYFDIYFGLPIQFLFIQGVTCLTLTLMRVYNWRVVFLSDCLSFTMDC